ncbi:MAG TPA: hypothetical protein VI653_01275 [Steroidobacteraceae bacterium]
MLAGSVAGLPRVIWLGAVGCAALAMSAGCSRTGQAAEDAQPRETASKSAGARSDTGAATVAKNDSAKDKDDKGGDKDSVVLPPEMAKRLGVITTQAQAITFTPSAEGFGVVLGHDSIAQIAADIETARAAARQSQAALVRAKQLANGPGALGVDALENATRQTSADQATLTLAQRKLTATLGLKFPRQGADIDEAVLTSLANGTFKLARITFPPGAIRGATPRELRLLPLEPSSDDPANEASLWTANTVWEGPQDPTIPGRSLFALLRTPDIPEGIRLQGLPASGHGEIRGVLIPSSAVVVSEGQYWCYLRKRSDSFTRVPISIDRPLAQGYFVPADRVAPGTEIVTAAAGLLLARQTNPSSESSD